MSFQSGHNLIHECTCYTNELIHPSCLMAGRHMHTYSQPRLDLAFVVKARPCITTYLFIACDLHDRRALWNLTKARPSTAPVGNEVLMAALRQLGSDRGQDLAVWKFMSAGWHQVLQHYFCPGLLRLPQLDSTHAQLALLPVSVRSICLSWHQSVRSICLSRHQIAWQHPT